MRRILLDTNAYSDLHRGGYPVKKEVLGAKIVCISVITLGELYRGFKIGKKEHENIKLLEDFLDEPRMRILNIDKKISKIYGQISYTIRKQGTPLPVNDVWIAAQAIETNSTLITYDRHFLKIPGLKIWNQIT